MSADELALLFAVLADPADDNPRLVLADWLEEHGRELRANAVRVMCREPHEFDAEVQTERMGYDDSRRPAHVRAVLTWLADYAPAELSRLLGGRKCQVRPGDWLWVQECPAIGLAVEWRRGFIATVRGPLEAVREWLPRIVTEHPVERVGASDVRSWRPFPEAKFVTLAAFLISDAAPGEPAAGAEERVSLIPSALGEHIPARFRRIDNDADVWWKFRDEPEAEDILSYALLREAVALPLPSPQTGS